MTADDPADPLVGAMVGNYRVTGLLGRGGMGTVYRAEHPEIGRQVAIKVVSAVFSPGDPIIARFKSEALAVNRIGHGNIIDISDFGALPDGRPYFVMEFLDGEDLGARLEKRGALPIQEIAPILRQCLDALAAAHIEGIVHRDLKPDNIFIARKRDGGEIVKLLDFGIAKLFGGGAGTGSTSDGTLLGTPIYMSPEQAMGRVSEIAPASDIYSMGVILYQLFTGRLPFERTTFGELLVAHATEAPPPPRQRKADLDPRIERLILRCLAKLPDERFPTVVGLRAALAEVMPEVAGAAPVAGAALADAARTGTRETVASTGAMAADPATTVPPEAPSPIPASPAAGAGRSRLRVAVAGVVLGLGLVGGGALWWARRAPPPLSASQIAPPPMPGPLLEGRER